MGDKRTFWSLYFGGKLKTTGQFLQSLKECRRGNENTNKAAERQVAALSTPPTQWELKGPIPERLSVPQAYFHSNTYLHQGAKADWQQTDHRLQEFSARFIETLRSRGIPIYAHSAFRGRKEQRMLFNKGRSKAQWPRAPHCQGKAVDLVHSHFHWDMASDEWAYLGKVGFDIAHKMAIPLTWGGNWSFYDPAHWELSDWKANILPLQETTPIRKTPRNLLRSLKV